MSGQEPGTTGSVASNLPGASPEQNLTPVLGPGGVPLTGDATGQQQQPTLLSASVAATTSTTGLGLLGDLTASTELEAARLKATTPLESEMAKAQRLLLQRQNLQLVKSDNPLSRTQQSLLDEITETMDDTIKQMGNVLHVSESTGTFAHSGTPSLAPSKTGTGKPEPMEVTPEQAGHTETTQQETTEPQPMVEDGANRPHPKGPADYRDSDVNMSEEGASDDGKSESGSHSSGGNTSLYSPSETDTDSDNVEPGTVTSSHGAGWSILRDAQRTLRKTTRRLVVM